MEKLPKQIENWLSEYSTESTKASHIRRIKRASKFLSMTLADLCKVSDSDTAKKLIFKLRDKMKSEGLSNNTVLGYISSLKNLFETLGISIRLRRSALPNPEMAIGYHAFSNGDLAKMHELANLRMKALLSVSVSLGSGISRISEMKRSSWKPLIERAITNNEKFIFSMSQRQKTGKRKLDVLNPLSIQDLHNWFKASEDKEYDTVFGVGTDQILQDFKKLGRIALGVPESKIRFHSIRKWLMSTLSKAGFNSYETKMILGKSIPMSDLTYLQNLENTIETKYRERYGKYLSIQPSTKQSEGLKTALLSAEKENKALKSDIEGLKARISELQDSLKLITGNVNTLMKDFKARNRPKKEKVEAFT